MLVLITYDVSTLEKNGARRLRRIARACQDYGIRVQKSVFECLVNETDWIKLKNRLLSEYNKDQDSLRFYFLDETDRKRVEHYGLVPAIDWDDPLIV